MNIGLTTQYHDQSKQNSTIRPKENDDAVADNILPKSPFHGITEMPMGNFSLDSMINNANFSQFHPQIAQMVPPGSSQRLPLYHLGSRAQPMSATNVAPSPLPRNLERMMGS